MSKSIGGETREDRFETFDFRREDFVEILKLKCFNPAVGQNTRAVYQSCDRAFRLLYSGDHSLSLCCVTNISLYVERFCSGSFDG
ncbi:MAG: hypothetical protein VR75_15760 [Hyphomonadaceae bacterium BRH_c29]|nr:MAG: hypothetical protein VR75_15760 [Hyphomonadaceae bacterium BRH_c29]